MKSHRNWFELRAADQISLEIKKPRKFTFDRPKHEHALSFDRKTLSIAIIKRKIYASDTAATTKSIICASQQSKEGGKCKEKAVTWRRHNRVSLIENMINAYDFSSFQSAHISRRDKFVAAATRKREGREVKTNTKERCSSDHRMMKREKWIEFRKEEEKAAKLSQQWVWSVGVVWEIIWSTAECCWRRGIEFLFICDEKRRLAWKYNCDQYFTIHDKPAGNRLGVAKKSSSAPFNCNFYPRVREATMERLCDAQTRV